MTPSRDELEQWIAHTRRVRRRMAVVLIAAFALSVAVAVLVGAIGGFAIVIVVLVAICTFWITGAHLLDWRRKLAELDRVHDANAPRRPRL